MERLLVVLAGKRRARLERLSDDLNRTEDMMAAASAVTEEEAVRALGETKARVLVTELRLETGDGLSLLRKAALMPSRVETLLFTEPDSPGAGERAMELGAAGLVEYPCAGETLAEQIRLAAEGMLPRENPGDYPAMRAERLLLELGIPPKGRGFRYLREGLRLQMEQSRPASELYAALAEIWDVSPAAVERSLRRTITGVWHRPETPARRRIWGELWGAMPPTNCRFLASAADYLARTWGGIGE